jgi:hypothetical protein
MYYEKNPKTFIGVENYIQGFEDGDDEVVIFIGEANLRATEDRKRLKLSMKTILDRLLDQGCL